ncbi:MAG TPA: hypothetical protein VEC57_07270 [Candidatus Limnocylindrales bacterium]|nr:hypothetical protein [Candidatus Limnocylindrales bacterium]
MSERRREVDVSEAELDAGLGVYTLFFSVPRFEIVFFKLVIESYEGLASGRSMDRHPGDDEGRVLEAVLAVPDLIEDTRRMLSWLLEATDAVQVPSSSALRRELREALSL